MLPKMTLPESLVAPRALQKGGRPGSLRPTLGAPGTTASAFAMPGSPRPGDHEYRGGQP